jgi:serine/threonine protein kinase/tetratricopeptide (TPR) repeat protein
LIDVPGTAWTLVPGEIVAHYRVISPIASGGMGQVYLAEDVRLGRKLALKVLEPRADPDDARTSRFEREARAISALNHPNIITIYDTGEVRGQRFIATEFIDGFTLRSLLGRGRIELRRALAIAMQMAEGLAVAHAAGVVHRDLKPENVMVRADGQVKVLDFGLAKVTGSDLLRQASEDATRRFETAEGQIMGTLRYMSPEQARGEETDSRTDVFALGVVLYEMLAGKPPFAGGSGADVISALILSEPAPLTHVPSELDRLVRTALRKHKGERYQSCAQLRDDLRTLLRTFDADGDTAQLPTPAVEPRSPTPSGGSLATPDRRSDSGSRGIGRRRRARRGIDSIAVLPLVNESGDRELDYLCDGLTERLINSLSPLPRLRVMARSTVFRYRSAVVDPRAVGHELEVRAVLLARVVRRGEALGVSAELVDTADGSQLWGAVLNRSAADLPSLEAEIARELTLALRLRLSRDQQRRLAKRHTASPAAYQLYLRGQYLANARTGQALREAQQLFEHAIVEDPDFALAYAALAGCQSLIAVNLRPSTVGATIRLAREAAHKALALDETLAEGHASLAFITFRFDWDWPRAEAEFARAIELNPGHAPTRQWHAMFLASRSRFDAALAEMQAALDLDPLSVVIQTGVGRILHFARRFDEALAQYDHVLRINPAYAQAYLDQSLTRLALGDHPGTRASLDRAEAASAGLSTVLLLRGLCAVREGCSEEGRRILGELESRHASGSAGVDDLALLAAALGDWDRALPWLKDACSRRAPFLGYVDVEPAMAPFRQHPGSRALLRQHGFDAIP